MFEGEQWEGLAIACSTYWVWTQVGHPQPWLKRRLPHAPCPAQPAYLQYLWNSFRCAFLWPGLWSEIHSGPAQKLVIKHRCRIILLRDLKPFNIQFSCKSSEVSFRFSDLFWREGSKSQSRRSGQALGKRVSIAETLARSISHLSSC